MTVAALSYSMVLCGGSPTDPYAHRYRARPIEKVKFGVPVSDAFPHDIPATLLVLLLKVNKEGPYKKDVWRAPGQTHKVQKLAAQMQGGRLVNIANVSVATAASVIKKFLSKIPGGIFGGAENEERLFAMAELEEPDKQRDAFCRIVTSLSVAAQHLLVLVFGTFRCICDAAATTRMNADALGVSVAPSLMHTCIYDGNRAKIEDVVRFRIASEVVARVIKNFGYSNLFPRENYEFYARITGRTLRLDENWQFTFHCPAELASSSTADAGQSALKEHGMKQTGRAPTTGRWSMDETRPRGAYERRISQQPAHTYGGRSATERARGNVTRQLPCVGQPNRPDTPDSADELLEGVLECTLAESTHSLSYLEWVHRRQQRRMVSRSEWFLSPERAAAAAGGGSSRPRCDTHEAAATSTAECSRSLYDMGGKLSDGGAAPAHWSTLGRQPKPPKEATHQPPPVPPAPSVARKRSLRLRQVHEGAAAAGGGGGGRSCTPSEPSAADSDPLVRRDSVKSAKKSSDDSPGANNAAPHHNTRVAHYRF